MLAIAIGSFARSPAASQRRPHLVFLRYVCRLSEPAIPLSRLGVGLIKLVEAGCDSSEFQSEFLGPVGGQVQPGDMLNLFFWLRHERKYESHPGESSIN